MPTTDIDDCVFPIRDRWAEIRRDFFEVVPGHYLIVTCAHRSPEEQFELFKKGRDLVGDQWVIVDKSKVVTNADGKTVMSAHNYSPARGVDLAIADNQTGKWMWDEQWFRPLIQIANRYGLVSGGSWRVLKDFPHIEVPNYKTYKGN